MWFDEGMATTNIESTALRIIDVLIEEGGDYTAEYGRVLSGLASLAFEREIRVGDPEYKAVSLAVLYLEQADFVTVERAHHDEAQKANVVLSVRLA